MRKSRTKIHLHKKISQVLLSQVYYSILSCPVSIFFIFAQKIRQRGSAAFFRDCCLFFCVAGDGKAFVRGLSHIFLGWGQYYFKNFVCWVEMVLILC